MSEPNFRHAVLLDDAKPKPKKHPPGTVVALASETGRYTRFAVCMQALSFNIPAGTAVKWMLGSDISESRNQACDEIEGEWVWFIDDDHAFREDVLLRLLDRDVDIVTPICLRRSNPFLPVPAENDTFLRLSDHRPDELVEVQHAGSSGMLVRKRVLDALEPPYFELGHREGDGNRVSEDVSFCRKAQAAGFKVHVDMSVRLGHITTAIVWPVWSEEHDRWLTGFTVADGAQLYIEPVEIDPEGEPEADDPS